MVRYLSQRLNSSGLSEITDIIILSDHGMDFYYFNPDDVDDSIIDLYRIVSINSCDMYGSSPVLQIIAKPGHNQSELCNKLKKAAESNGNFSIYTDDDLKERQAYWHVQNDRRYGKCIAVAEPGHVFQEMRQILKKYLDYDRCK